MFVFLGEIASYILTYKKIVKMTERTVRFWNNDGLKKHNCLKTGSVLKFKYYIRKYRGGDVEVIR